MYNIWTLGRTRHPTAILQASDKRMRESPLLGMVRTKVVKCKRQRPTSKLSIKRGQAEEERVQRRECEGRRSLVSSLAALFAHHYWWASSQGKETKRNSTFHGLLSVFQAFR